MKLNYGFACPCCRYMALNERGVYDICPVCFWEDDGGNDPNQVSSPNHITLRTGQANFERFGACDEAARIYVLKNGSALFERAND